MRCATCGHDLVEGAAYCPRCGERVDGVAERDDYAYEAFISYRHLPVDRNVAVRLQRSLEGFRIPRQLQEAAGRRRLGKCFRDEDELPTSDSLSDQIEEALRRSRYLVVVCTPKTRESRWVLREVELFASYHGRHNVLVALAEGEPDESFPQLLLSQARVADDGSVTDEPVEPLAADFRDLSRGKFSVERLRIASTLIGCGFDDLRQRQRMRTTRLVTTISLLVAVVSAVFGGMATYQEARIRESYRQIQLRESEFLASEASDLLETGNRYQALQVALAALPDAESGVDRPFVPAAQMALERALGAYPEQGDWLSCYAQEQLLDRVTNDGVCYGEGGLDAIVAHDRFVEVHDTLTGSLVSRFDAESALGIEALSSDMYCAMTFAGDRLVVVFGDVAGCFDAQTGQLVWELHDEDLAYRNDSVALSPDGSQVALVQMPSYTREDMLVHLVDVDTGAITKTLDLPGFGELGCEEGYWYSEEPPIAFSPDGATLAVGSWKTLLAVDVATGAVTQRALRHEEVVSLRYVGDVLSVTSRDYETRFLPGNEVALEVFDASLSPLWARDAVLDPLYDGKGNSYYSSLGAFGTWSYHAGDDQQLVVLLGTDLLLLDARTGKEEACISGETPFLGCSVLEVAGQRRICACTADGTVMVRVPLDTNEGLGGSAYDLTLGDGYLRSAEFVVADGRVCCSLWEGLLERRLVYRLWSTDDMVGDRPLDVEVTSGSVRSFWFGDESDVVLRMDNELLFLDGDTLQLLSRTSMDKFSLLDPEVSYSYQLVQMPSGYCYLAGQSPKQSDGYRNVAVYRVSAQDGSVDLVALIPQSYSLDAFDSVLDDGSERLLLAGHLKGTHRVMVLDPDNPRDDARNIDVEVPGADRAWCDGDRLVVYLRDGLKESGRFMLVDARTGDELACDLSNYDVARPYSSDLLCSLSYDGSTFAVSCSDGLLRLFDAHEGSLLWETDQAPADVNLLQMTRQGNVFTQDMQGRCVLVSGATGDVLQASMVALPRFRGALHHSDDNTIVAYFSEGFVLQQSGIAIVSLDEEAFGPLSVMYDGMLVSHDSSLLMYADRWSGLLHVAQRPSLDELEAQANELVVGHGLSESEKSLYHVS